MRQRRPARAVVLVVSEDVCRQPGKGNVVHTISVPRARGGRGVNSLFPSDYDFVYKFERRGEAVKCWAVGRSQGRIEQWSRFACASVLCVEGSSSANNSAAGRGAAAALNRRMSQGGRRARQKQRKREDEADGSNQESQA